MPLGDIDLDPNLVPDMLRNPSTTPPLHPNNIGLRQDRHPASLAPNRSTCCDVHLNPPAQMGPKSGVSDERCKWPDTLSCGLAGKGRYDRNTGGRESTIIEGSG